MYILSLAAYCTSGPSKSRSSALCLCTWWHRKSLYKKCYWNRKFSILGMSAAVSACRTAARPMPCWTCSSNDCFTSGASADAIVLYICSCLCMYVCMSVWLYLCIQDAKDNLENFTLSTCLATLVVLISKNESLDLEVFGPKTRERPKMKQRHFTTKHNLTLNVNN